MLPKAVQQRLATVLLRGGGSAEAQSVISQRRGGGFSGLLFVFLLMPNESPRRGGAVTEM
jgi:hypothetical protein